MKVELSPYMVEKYGDNYISTVMPHVHCEWCKYPLFLKGTVYSFKEGIFCSTRCYDYYKEDKE